jgi:hypothetical protein
MTALQNDADTSTWLLDFQEGKHQGLTEPAESSSTSAVMPNQPNSVMVMPRTVFSESCAIWIRLPTDLRGPKRGMPVTALTA